MNRLLSMRHLLAVQFSFFAVVGAVNTAIDAGMYLLFSRGAGMEPLIASMLSFLAGSVNSYVMNRRLTFSSSAGRTTVVRQYGRFLLVTTAMVGLHQLNLLVFHYGLGFPDLVGKLSGIVMGVVVGFSLNKHWVFKLVPERA